MKAIKYNNLGQMINGRLVYLRSTDIEQKNYHRLLWSVPDEWFYLLAKGRKIIVNDISSNKKGKVERIFLPVLCDVLNYILLDKEPESKRLLAHFNIAVNEIDIDSSLRKRITFWRGKINKKIDIIGKTKIAKEPNPLNDLIR